VSNGQHLQVREILAPTYESLNQLLSLCRTRSLSSASKSGQQVGSHFSKAFGQALILAVFCQTRAYLRLTPEVHREHHNGRSPYGRSLV
jgi:hypothetical protein